MKNIFSRLDLNPNNSFFSNSAPSYWSSSANYLKLEETLKDPHLWSCVQSRKSGTLALSKSFGNQNQLIDYFIQKIDYNSISNLVLDSIYFGLSVIELIWEKIKINGKEYILPLNFKQIPNNLIAFDNSGIAKLNFSNKFEDINPYKVLITNSLPSPANPQKDCLLVKCYPSVQLKKAALRLWANYMEKHGFPLVLGKYPTGTKHSEAQKLLDDLVNMTEDSVIITPEEIDIKFEMINTATGSEIFSTMIDKCNAEISKAILSQTLTTEIGNGSKAAAETHLKIRSEIIESDAHILESAWNKILNMIAEINSLEELPKFTINISELELDYKLARDTELSQKCGVQFTKTYWIRNYGFAEDELG